ncbi:MAG: type II toxin-antitoxin system RatA family toxin [Betaproteobacteria bacterium]
MKKIARSAILPHSAEALYALVEDIEAYPRFLPWCRAVRVERSGAGTRAQLQVGLKGLRQSFTTQNENHPGRAIDLRLVAGPFRSFSAAWRFHPLEAGACRVEFSMQYEFSSRALARVLEPLFATIADSMVDAFSRRADALHGQDQG